MLVLDDLGELGSKSDSIKIMQPTAIQYVHCAVAAIYSGSVGPHYMCDNNEYLLSQYIFQCVILMHQLDD